MAIYTGSNKHLGGTETVARKETFFYGLVQKNVLITGANGVDAVKRHSVRSNIKHRIVLVIDDKRRNLVNRKGISERKDIL